MKKDFTLLGTLFELFDEIPVFCKIPHRWIQLLIPLLIIPIFKIVVLMYLFILGVDTVMSKIHKWDLKQRYHDMILRHDKLPIRNEGGIDIDPTPADAPLEEVPEEVELTCQEAASNPD
jgi:hypothetical protein